MTRRFTRAVVGVMAFAAVLCTTAFTPAFGDDSGYSANCTDGVGTEVGVVDYPVTLGVESSTFGDGSTHTLVCWSSSPRYGSEPEASGGHIHLITYADGSTTLQCLADRGSSTVFALDCDNHVAVGDPDPASTGNSVTGSVQAAWTAPTPIGQTGVESGDIDTFLFSDAAGATASRTCLWVLGTQLAPGCFAENTEGGLNWGDAPDLDNTGNQCAVWIDPSSCTLYFSRSYVLVGGDSRPTVEAQIGPDYYYYDLPSACLGFCP